MRASGFLLAAVLCLCSCTQKMVQPSFLQKGDKVAVVAPSCKLADSLLQRACLELRAAGLVPVVGSACASEYPACEPELSRGQDPLCFYAGEPPQRAEDLIRALEDPEIKAVICARGGYGAIQILPLLPKGIWRRNPKWIVGYSDITALHMACQKEGVMSLHANMCGELGALGLREEGNAAMLDFLFGRSSGQYGTAPCRYNIPGRAQGVLLGGNMITLVSLLGSPYDPLGDRDCILFLEEVSESMHSIDRLFNMLLLQGKLSRVKGIVFGDFTDCGDEFAMDSAAQMLHRYTSTLDIPVCFGFPAGHGALNLPLAEGERVVLEVGEQGAVISSINAK